MTARQRITTGLGAAVLAGGLVFSLVLVPTAGAGELRAASGARPDAPTLVLDQQTARDAEKLAREGMTKMLQALNRLVESIPQYQLPEITENGDIIIRRKPPDAPPHPAQMPPRGGEDNRAI